MWSTTEDMIAPELRMNELQGQEGQGAKTFLADMRDSQGLFLVDSFLILLFDSPFQYRIL